MHRLFFLCFIPYLMVILMNGADTALLIRKFNMEMILPVITAAQISDDYELETIKAQTIKARSNLIRQIQESGVRAQLKELQKTGNKDIFLKKLLNEKYETATNQTEGLILTAGQQLKTVPYHEISAGKTREGAECLHDSEYDYLKSVESTADKEADGYLTGIYVSANRLPDKLVIKTRDSAGYVTELLADGKVLEGESFRMGMGLPSSNFTVQRIGKSIRFMCRGKGHGLGFSQYGGNALAKEQQKAEEILAVYFPEMELTDVEELQIQGKIKE